MLSSSCTPASRPAADRRSPRLRLRSHSALVSGGALAVGRDLRGALTRIPIGDAGGSHRLLVGATGSGKTVTEAWILARAIEHGHGAVVIDPKGDVMLREQLRAAALRAGRPFIEWTPAGPSTYNPYARGSDSEIVDKALAAEPWSEPHYLRQAQRYLGHAVRALHAAGEVVSPARLMEVMDPRALEVLSRSLPEESDARTVWGYLDTLDARQRAGLSGARDRLAILAESELGCWLAQAQHGIDLLQAVRWRAVVLFRLDADRLPLLAAMLGAAVVQDLIGVSAQMQGAGVATQIAIDEFSAVAATGVSRLFSRARGAAFSVTLITQELADLDAASASLREQVLGNVESVIVHRQSVPESARLLSELSGSRAAWSTSERLERGLTGPRPSGAGTRTRELVPIVSAEQIRTLAAGHAAVMSLPGSGTSLTRIFDPEGGRR